MRHRIFVDDVAGPAIEVSGDEFHHAVRVVRVREGEEIEVFDRRGGAARGRVGAIGRDALRVDVESPIPSRESPVRIHLGAAIIQLEKFELILQKATELGASSITPLMTDRVEIREERFRGKRDRWDKIVFEAVKQSGRMLIPRVNDPTRFDEIVKQDGPRIVFDSEEEPGTAPERATELTILIGPEGGWSEREIALARETRCIFQRLGPRRLRAETAAIASLAVLASRYGDI
jgi:16S rRNA (uracil1498-N3)-methyltransferase